MTLRLKKRGDKQLERALAGFEMRLVGFLESRFDALEAAIEDLDAYEEDESSDDSDDNTTTRPTIILPYPDSQDL